MDISRLETKGKTKGKGKHKGKSKSDSSNSKGKGKVKGRFSSTTGKGRANSLLRSTDPMSVCIVENQAIGRETAESTNTIRKLAKFDRWRAIFHNKPRHRLHRVRLLEVFTCLDPSSHPSHMLLSCSLHLIRHMCHSNNRMLAVFEGLNLPLIGPMTCQPICAMSPGWTT